MSKKSKSDVFKNKVVAVWLIQNHKRFLLNFFNSFEMAKRYVDAFKHMRINGELLMGELAMEDLIEQ